MLSACSSVFYLGFKGSIELPNISNLWTIDALKRLKSLVVQLVKSFPPSELHFFMHFTLVIVINKVMKQ